MREQLKRLEELQRHDARIQELENSLKAIPAKMKAMENDLTRIEALLNQEKAQLQDAQRYYKDQKDLVESDSGHLNDAKIKLNQVKNTREFGAAQRELEQTKESVATREAEIAKLVDAIGAKEKLLAERSAEVGKLRESIAKDSESARGKMSELESRIAELRTERDKVAALIKPDVLKRYGTIRIRRGVAIAAVRSGTCSACNMNLPPQLFNVLQRGNSIESCPYCQRIIYWEELMKEEPVSTDGSSPPSSSAPAA